MEGYNPDIPSDRTQVRKTTNNKYETKNILLFPCLFIFFVQLILRESQVQA